MKAEERLRKNVGGGFETRPLREPTGSIFRRTNPTAPFLASEIFPERTQSRKRSTAVLAETDQNQIAHSRAPVLHRLLQPRISLRPKCAHRVADERAAFALLIARSPKAAMQAVEEEV